MALTDEFLQELRFRNDIVDVVSGYVKLKRVGSNMAGLCPFHNEDTASFIVYPDNESFYCFGCAVGGDVITFTKKIENLDYINTIKFLAHRAGLAMPEDNANDEDLKIRQRLFEINREAARFFHASLYSSEGKKALTYLKGRALSEKTVKHFGLGYSSYDRFSLVNHLRGLKYKDSEMIFANLAYESKSGKLIDRFVGRLMFPIIDLRGNVIAFGGRSLGDEKPKYLNTSDTRIFKKSLNLFSLNFAKKTSSGRLILAEGYMDVIALNQAGFSESVATLGTAITEQQAKIMKSYTKEVVIAYDSDEAGQKATARAIKILRNAGLSIKVITIPKGKDPDEYIRYFKDQGSIRFNKLINTSLNDVEYRLSKLKQNFDVDTAQGKVSFLKEAVKILAEVNDDIERDVYSTKLALELDIDRLAMKSQVEKQLRKTRRVSKEKQFKKLQENMTALKDSVNPQKRKNLRAANAEESLISYIIKNPDQANNIFLQLPAEKFCTDFNRKVYSYIKDVISKKHTVCVSDFTQHFSDDEVSRIVKILVSGVSFGNGDDFYKDCIMVILDEKEKIDINKHGLEDLSEIKSYMERLKKQKK